MVPWCVGDDAPVVDLLDQPIASRGGGTVPTHEPRFSIPLASGETAYGSDLGQRLSLARLVFVSAPAGYGKTLHVAGWARACGRPVAWIDLEWSDNDPHVLLVHLTAMLRDVACDDLDDRSGLSMSPASSEDILVPEFAHLVSRCTRPFVLVLDDLHVIENPVALGLITALARHMSPGSTVVLVGRCAPPPTFASLSMDPAFEMITAQDLALDRTAARSMADAIGWYPSDDHLDHLVAETEGCPVGIGLAGLPHEEADDGREPTGGPTSARNRLVADYVHAEWLRGLTLDDVDFLRRVSGLGRLCGGLCDHVLGRSDSGQVLERLLGSTLFVIPLDCRGDSYRLHRMLDDVLDSDSRQADSDGQRSLAARASEWFENNGDVDSAILQALRADDIDRAVDLAERYAEQYQTNGGARTVDRWIALLPRDRVFASPQICLMSAVLAMGRCDIHAVSTWLRLAEQAANDAAISDGDPTFALKLAALGSVLSTGDADDALADAERAYGSLEPGTWHVVACLARGHWLLAIGDAETAIRTLSEGASEARLLGAPTLEAKCLASQAFAFAAQGEWARAQSVVSSARQVVCDHDLGWMPTLVTVTSMSAWAEATAGDPNVARAEVLSTRHNLAQFDKVASWFNLQSRIALIRASLLLGEEFEAQTLHREAVVLLDTMPSAVWAAEQLDELASAIKSAHTALPCGPVSLTPAELRMLRFLPTNLTLGGIGQRLFVSRNTAKSHAAAIYRKLGVSSRSEAVEVARHTGLLSEEPII